MNESPLDDDLIFIVVVVLLISGLIIFVIMIIISVIASVCYAINWIINVRRRNLTIENIPTIQYRFEYIGSVASGINKN
jgi:hypothetical protein